MSITEHSRQIAAYKNFIGGKWIDSISDKMNEVKNPATNEVVGYAPVATKEEVEQAITTAKKALSKSDWAVNPKKRYTAIFTLAQKLEENTERIARLITLENGRPIRETRIEVASSIDMLKYFAGMSRNVFGRSVTLGPHNYGTIVKEPIGLVGIITPWNWPVLLLIRELAPALAAGNSVIVKPASYTPLSTLEIFQLISEIKEFDAGIINVVCGSGAEIGSTLASSKEIDMISFTGDTSTGRAVMQSASSNFKKLALELGGKSPNIVFADANIKRAIETIGRSMFMSAGQMCFAGTRVVIQDSIKDEVISGLKAYAENLTVGNGIYEETDMGPLVSQSQIKVVTEYCDIAKNEGKIITGGSCLSGSQYENGYFFAPTIVDELNENSRLIQEEIFGPILTVQSFHDEDEAISLANGTKYGLAAGVWTNNLNRATRVSRAVKAGTVWVNTYNENFAEAEFGGYKESGLGRTRGIDGLLEYTETKHINFKVEDYHS
jgi:betaine-aldehyde dehydrogenase